MKSVAFRPTSIDGLLALMVLIWGSNYSIVKAALAEIPPLAFNGVRLIIASALFLAALAAGYGRRAAANGNSPGGLRLTRGDWLALAGLGVIGHFTYQLCFMSGLARTTASNSALILGCSPIATGMLTAAVGHERVNRVHWIAAALSVGGIYLLVGHDFALGGPSRAGDLLTLGAVCCWSIYTVGSRALLDRHSPLVVTGCSMAIGTALYVPVAARDLGRVSWAALGGDVWAALVFSAVFALFTAYLIWYTAVQRIGNIRTSIYSNLLPVVAVLVAAAWLGDRLSPARITGAAAILAGVFASRLVVPPAAAAPAEE